MEKLLTFILPAALMFAVSTAPQPAAANELTRSLHAVDRSVARTLGAEKCHNVRDRYWSERRQRWVWTTTRVCRRIR